jgi:hypothetical protein
VHGLNELILTLQIGQRMEGEVMVSSAPEASLKPGCSPRLQVAETWHAGRGTWAKDAETCRRMARRIR